jgi:hypothetical protein
VKTAIHTWLSVAFLVVIGLASYALDVLVLAGAQRTAWSIDMSWVWAQLAARLVISALVLMCATFVLFPPRPSRVVAVLYLLVGAYFTLLPVPYFGALFRFETWTTSPTRVALPIAAAFLVVIGIAAFFRPYASQRERKT